MIDILNASQPLQIQLKTMFGILKILGFGIWDSVDLGFRILRIWVSGFGILWIWDSEDFGIRDLGTWELGGGRELVNGFGKYGIGE